MNRMAMAAVGGFALLLAGCQTAGGPQSMASAPQASECKAVVVTSTAEQMRLQNQQGVPTDGIKQAEGELALGRVQRQPAGERRPAAARAEPREPGAARLLTTAR